MSGLFIATPCYGASLHAGYVASLLETQAALIAAGVEHMIRLAPGDSLVSRIRNVMVAQFMATDCDRFLFIDADIAWRPDSILRLIADTQHEELPIVGGIYPRKQIPVQFPVNWVLDADLNLTQHDETGCIEVRDAPTGFLMIRREVFERLMLAYPERRCVFRESVPDAEAPYEYALFDCFIDRATGHYLSEDFGFSRLWQQIGGRIFADPAITLSHYGQFRYEGSIRSVMKYPDTGKGDRT